MSKLPKLSRFQESVFSLASVLIAQDPFVSVSCPIDDPDAATLFCLDFWRGRARQVEDLGLFWNAYAGEGHMVEVHLLEFGV